MLSWPTRLKMLSLLLKMREKSTVPIAAGTYPKIKSDESLDTAFSEKVEWGTTETVL